MAFGEMLVGYRSGQSPSDASTYLYQDAKTYRGALAPLGPWVLSL